MIILFLLALLPLVYVYLRKKEDYLELKRPARIIGFISIYLVICFACAVVVFTEMGIVYLGGLLVGGIHFTSSFSLVWATTMIILISEIVHVFIRVTTRLYTKKLPNWLIEICTLPVSMGIIFFVPRLFDMKVSWLAAVVITGLIFIANSVIREN
ncbi:hypothetical protein EJP77_10020 [Paenibacillus zeisoli]|uniref:Uncharacterized protein n=1 Tax=Paenibacillus zeisoli TaxID=2496267 RepID=A0A3S1B7N1_9BACL|nr:hypothetical protein [Paenibacillus zeisoli]RUT31716.1 hypothetical protein EJP77_10020 [Paenibacillus zeisoli]